MARELGITSPLDEGVPAIGLGGLRVGVTPLEMAHAYATIANKGVRMGGSVLFHSADAPIQDPTLDPITIERIRIPGEKDVVNTPKSRSGWSSETNALAAIDAMRGVLTVGTGERAYFGRPAAGKTGTTSDYKDAWFAGFTPQRAAAVWVGHVRPAREMDKEFKGDPVSGGTLPGGRLEVVHEPGAPEAAGGGLAGAAERLQRPGAGRPPLRHDASARPTAAATPASSSWPPTRRRRSSRRARAASSTCPT